MRRIAFALALSACAPRTVPEVAPHAGDADARVFTRLAIEPDGRIAVGLKGETVARAEQIPVPADPGRVWLTTQCAPTRAAIDQLAKISDIADARGWFLVARILPSAASIKTPKHTKPPKMLEAQVINDGSILINGFSAPPEAVRTLLPSKGCAEAEAVALTSSGATPPQLFAAAGHLAAAGCEVMIVRRPPGS